MEHPIILSPKRKEGLATYRIFGIWMGNMKFEFWMDSNEGYLRSQFQAADKTSSGYLLPHEFGELLRQLNIDMTSKEIADVFDEVNTDRTEIEGTVYILGQ